MKPANGSALLVDKNDHEAFLTSSEAALFALKSE